MSLGDRALVVRYKGYVIKGLIKEGPKRPFKRRHPPPWPVDDKGVDP